MPSASAPPRWGVGPTNVGVEARFWRSGSVRGRPWGFIPGVSGLGAAGRGLSSVNPWSGVSGLGLVGRGRGQAPGASGGLLDGFWPVESRVGGGPLT